MKMAFQPRTQILCKSDIVELFFSIKGVNPVSTPNVLFDNLLMLVQSIPGNVFEMLADEVIHTGVVKE